MEDLTFKIDILALWLVDYAKSYRLYAYCSPLCVRKCQKLQRTEPRQEKFLSIDVTMIVFSPVLLKEELQGSSLAHSNCLHHHSCALGPFLNKIRVLCM